MKNMNTCPFSLLGTLIIFQTSNIVNILKINNKTTRHCIF